LRAKTGIKATQEITFFLLASGLHKQGKTNKHPHISTSGSKAKKCLSTSLDGEKQRFKEH
jgi:hypothetical protein